MTHEISIQSKTDSSISIKDNSVDNRIGTVFGNGNVGSSSSPSVTVTSQTHSVSSIKTAPKRSAQDVDKFIKNLIKEYDISLEEMKKILDYCGYTETKLETVNNDELDKLGRCISQALGFVIKDGKINKQELPLNLLAFKFCMVDRGLSSSKSVEAVEAAKDKDLFDIIQAEADNNPKLAQLKKFLNGRDIHSLSAEELKNIFKHMLTGLLTKSKQKTPEAYIDFFLVAVDKCDDKEKAKIFHAFALLLKDESMKELVPQMYQKLTKAYGNVNELAKLINKIGPEVLRLLGFGDEIIQVINFQALETLEPDKLKAIVDTFLTAFNQIPEKDLPVLKEVLTAINTGNLDNLTPEQLRVLEEHLGLITNTVNTIALNAKDPQLANKLKESFKPLLELLLKQGLSEGIMNQVMHFYEKQPELFKGIDFEKFAKSINEVTENKFSEAIGDTNPEHLYKPEGKKDSLDTAIGLPQKTSPEEHSIAFEQLQNTRLLLTEEKPGQQITVEEKPEVKLKKNDLTLATIKTQALKSIETFNDALDTGMIKIDDAGKDFNNACKSVQQRVLSFLQREKNNRLALINKWHNSQLADVAANKFNFDEEQIEELELSIGKKQVMLNNFRQQHKTDSDIA